MAVPTSAKTFYDLLIKVAEKLGIASYRTNGTPYPPVADAYNFWLCKSYVNGGINTFIANPPKNGWRWMRRILSLTFVPAVTGTATAGEATSLTCAGIAGDYADDYFNTFLIRITAGTGLGETATVTDYTGLTGKFDFTALSGGSTPDTTTQFTICPSLNVINADPSRYYLPDDFPGSTPGKLSYVESTNHGTPISWVDESYIRDLRSEINVSTGYPLYAAIRPLEPSTPAVTGNRRWELLIYPRPTAADSIEFPYELFFDDLRMEGGAATGGSSTTLVDSARVEPDDYFNGWTIKIIAGTGQGSKAVVTDYTASTGTFAVADWLTSEGAAGGVDPVATSVYVVEPVAFNCHPAGFAHDMAIEAACLSVCEVEGRDSQNDTHHTELFYKNRLPTSQAHDARTAPRTLGKMVPNFGPYSIRRVFNNVTTDHDE